MPAVPPNFEVNLRIIRALRSLPTTGCRGNCGYTAQEILDRYNALFPDHTLTLDQLFALLKKGTGKGIYRTGGCSTGAVGPTSCGAFQATDAHALANTLFYINTAMAAANFHNAAYVAVGYATNPNVVRTGYLPCSSVFNSGGGGAGYNPYSRSSSGGLNSAGSVGITGGGQGGASGAGGGTGNGGYSNGGGCVSGLATCPAVTI